MVNGSWANPTRHMYGLGRPRGYCPENKVGGVGVGTENLYHSPTHVESKGRREKEKKKKKKRENFFKKKVES